MIKLINIAVVDDESIIREQIKSLIVRNIDKKTYECQVDIYSTGEDLLAAKKYYDVIFLDIQMDGMNGIKIAKKLRTHSWVNENTPSKNTQNGNIQNDVMQQDSILIFITGIKEYVFDAFDVSAFHYLLKPIDEKKFASVLGRAIFEVEMRRRQQKEQLFIKTRNRNVTLNQSSILYIESRAKKVEIHTAEEVIEMYATMNELEKQLSKNFYRCHRGYLVNMAFIAEYNNDSITLSNGEDIILSKEKYSEFVKVYMRYLRNGGTVCG